MALKQQLFEKFKDYLAETYSSRYTENRPDKYMRKLFFDMKENLTWKWAVWGMFDILQEKGLDEKNINYWI